jgi:galactokinase
VEVVEEFRARTGVSPAVLASAPGRVNLIGEHLDYNGGRALPLALTARTRVAGAPRADGRLVIESLQRKGRVVLEWDDLDTAPSGWAAYAAGVVWALGLGGSGCTLLVDGDVPLGAGLSSSAALQCAVALAVSALAGARPPGEEVVAACVRAENEYVGAATGAMDQTVSMFAEAGHALLVDFATGTRRPVPWRPPGRLLVVDTRAVHDHAGGGYAERRAACEEAAAALGVDHLAAARADEVGLLEDPVARRRARHVVSEDRRVTAALAALEAGDWGAVGRLMTASHGSLRDDFEVSCPELDVTVDAALAAGALGARMTGGGFGGSAIVLTPPGADGAIREAVARAFASEGFGPPRFLDGTAGAAASVSLLPG